MPRFRYAANSSQSRYGALSHAAAALRREKSAIMNSTSTISPASQKNAGPCAPSRKNSTGHRPLTASWMLQSAVASLRARPELLRDVCTGGETAGKVSFKGTIAVIALAAVLVGGGLSLLASGNPDGLEWSLFGNSDAGYTQNMGLDEDSYGVQSSAADKAGAVQEKTAFLPDYSFAGSDSAAGTSVSGIAGAAIVAAAAALICGVGGICRHKKRHQS